MIIARVPPLTVSVVAIQRRSAAARSKRLRKETAVSIVLMISGPHSVIDKHQVREIMAVNRGRFCQALDTAAPRPLLASYERGPVGGQPRLN
jgi:hypothetical protein